MRPQICFTFPGFGFSLFYNENTVFKVWLGLDRKPLGLGRKVPVLCHRDGTKLQSRTHTSTFLQLACCIMTHVARVVKLLTADHWPVTLGWIDNWLNQLFLCPTECPILCFSCTQDGTHLSTTGPAGAAQTEGEQHLPWAGTPRGIDLDGESHPYVTSWFIVPV